MTSAFLSNRAWGGKPEPTFLIRCQKCDFRFFERGLSGREAANYYKDYRDSTYLRDRSWHEWFYTRRLHEALSEWMSSEERARSVEKILREAGFPAFRNALDYGGGSGHLMAFLRSEHKAVFDMSEAPASEGISKISNFDGIAPGAFDCVICAQTLEHCSDPVAEVMRIVEAMAPGGVLYLELPNEHWKGSFRLNAAQLGILHLVLAAAQKSPLLFRLLDTLFTGIRVKFGILPSFGFVPMREHLNYFSLEAIRELAKSCGLDVLVFAGTGCPYVVARKPINAK